MKDSEPADTDLIDAATVVVGRDTNVGLEVLMLKKTSSVYFAGMWVFPGGRVDADDQHRGDTDPMMRFRRAAAREAHEEAGLALSTEPLVYFSHWLPPTSRPKRYSTHFFITHAPAKTCDIKVDGQEIEDFLWITPRDALAGRRDGDFQMVAPTFVTLDWLLRFDCLADAIADIGEPVLYHSRLVMTEQGRIALYEGDAGYESLDPLLPGPRRRANMLGDNWWWEEHDGNGNGPFPYPAEL